MRALRATAAEGSGATGPERATAQRLADKLAREYEGTWVDRTRAANAAGFFTFTIAVGSPRP
ncbi:MAG: hypothetical protein V4510_09600 [bacterium]